MNPLSKEQINFYKKFGYLVIPNVFSSYHTRKIKAAAQLCKKQKVGKIIYEKDKKTLRSLMSYHNKNKVLEYYTYHPKIMDFVKQIVKSKVYVSQSKINLKKSEKGKKWDLHRGFSYWHLLDGMPTNRMISVFICLTKQTKKNGAVFVLEKSHCNIDTETIKKESNHQGNREDDTSENLSIQIKDKYQNKYFDKFKKTFLMAKTGDVIIMHSCILHASENNNSKKSRDLMISVFNPIDNLPTRFDRPDYLCEKSPY